MKFSRMAALALASTLALTACSSESTTEEPDATGSEQGGEITVWLAGETDTPEPAVTWLKTEAKAQYDIDVTVERIGWGDLLSRVTTTLGDTSQTPDIVELGNTQVQAFTHAGGFADITPLWDELGGDSLALQGMVEGGSVEDTLYAAPYYAGSRVVFYDAADVDEAPETLEDLTELAASLNKDGHSGFYLGGQDWRNAISWLFAYGGNIATYDGDQWVGQLSSPESLAGLEAVQELYQTGTQAPKDATDADTWVPFNEGRASMFIAPGWAAGLIELDQWSAFALPGAEGGAAPVFLGGSNIGISAASDNQTGAQQVMKLMLSEDYQLILAEAGLTTIYPQHADLAAGDPVKEASAAAAADGKITPASPQWAAFEETKTMEEMFFEIANGGDVAEIAAKYDEIITSALN
ncbi:extracellular solute-binding protein [Jonesia quinghaiensis]|uniref:extracellular solute-binding protein n=1 Tax=Jonesia quinghaiensis TaxID=262806 RepID=UPI0003F89DDD|nr:extracellular solute-binding protein [Jonesia quinghaiensis]